MQRQNDEQMNKLKQIDGQAQGVLKKREEDVGSYRDKVIELKQQIAENDNQI